VSVIWIEHYDRLAIYGEGEEDFSRVLFTSFAPRPTWVGGVQWLRLGDPTWWHLRRTDVELLIGQTL
jgi:hypothetical protein